MGGAPAPSAAARKASALLNNETTEVSEAQRDRDRERAEEEARARAAEAAKDREFYAKRVVKMELESIAAFVGELGEVTTNSMATRPVASLPASSKTQLRPLLEEMDDCRTTQKKMHAINDFLVQHPSRSFTKDEVRARSP